LLTTSSFSLTVSWSLPFPSLFGFFPSLPWLLFSSSLWWYWVFLRALLFAFSHFMCSYWNYLNHSFFIFVFLYIHTFKSLSSAPD
jgi:uncharacterized membrane protein YesL